MRIEYFHLIKEKKPTFFEMHFFLLVAVILYHYFCDLYLFLKSTVILLY